MTDDKIEDGQQLAVQQVENEIVATPLPPLMAHPKFTFKQIIAMAGYVAQCGLYGVKTLEQTVSIMLVAQATGQHPVLAARDYHILTFTDKKGRVGCMPTLKADVILGRFLEAGGQIEYLDYTDKKVTIKFTWKNTTLPITWDIDRVQKAGLLNNDLYNKYPQQMMKARCVAEGVKAVCPQVTMGIYSTEEAESFLEEDIEPPAPAFKAPIPLPPKAEALAAPAAEAPALTKDESIKPVELTPPASKTEITPETAREKFANYTMDKFKADCRQLFVDVKAGTIDKDTGRRHYFVYTEELALINEAVPSAVQQASDNVLYK